MGGFLHRSNEDFYLQRFFMKMKNEGEIRFFFRLRRFEDLKNGFRNTFVKIED
jgi:hypothetical protein